MGRILQGYSFPLMLGCIPEVASCTPRNPKWVVCDKGQELSTSDGFHRLEGSLQPASEQQGGLQELVRLVSAA